MNVTPYEVDLDHVSEPIEIAVSCVEIGHAWPDGHIDEHTQIQAAQCGVLYRGGEIVTRMLYAGPWYAAPELMPASWVVPE
jgi:hypothetical protein